MGESTYKPPIRDSLFVLHEFLPIQDLLKYPKYNHLTMDDLDMTVKEAANYAKNSVSPINYESDREGAQYKDGKVTTPAEFKPVYNEFTQNGWNALMYDMEFGGSQMPQVVGIMTLEFFCAACQAFALYPFAASSASHVIESYGADELKQKYCEIMYSGKWGGTMCLTEPHAGSAVGDTKTSATPVGDGTYKMKGTKIFITGAEQDLTENIIHLVLARLPDAPPGIKGISLFLVPKYLVNDDKSLGEYNDVFVSGIEHKMGIKGSATCVVNFGDNDNCIGWLIGEPNQGIKYMFQMMNEARMVVGLQGLALGGAAYQDALEYTKDRVQGVDVLAMKDPNAPRVTIINHPDVKRMLLFQKSMTEALRAFMMSIAFYMDLAGVIDDEKEKEKYKGWAELLLPICKAYGSDQGFEVTRVAIQCFGGYGFCGDYPVEQHCRDAKIASIYEGTNGIQALDLLGRKMAAKQGQVFMGFVNEMSKLAKDNKDNAVLGKHFEMFAKGVKTLSDTAMFLMQKSMTGNMIYPISVATPFLELFGHVVMCFFILKQALIAVDKLEKIYSDEGAGDDAAKKKVVDEKAEAGFYSGKIQSAKFFAAHILPGIYSIENLIKSEDTTVLEVSQNAF